MSAERDMLDGFLRPYKRRLLLLSVWDSLITGLLFSLAPALLSVFTGFSLWIYLLFGLSLAGGFFRHMRLGALNLHIDDLTDSGGEIITLIGYIDKPESGLFLPLLLERVRVRLTEKPAGRCIPLYFRRRFGRSLLLFSFLSILIVLPIVTGGKEAAPDEIIRQSAARLAEVSKKDPGFAPMAERLDDLQQELAGETLPEQKAEEIEELAAELTEHIREIERNSLTRYFEEQGLSAADRMESLAIDELSLPETRELILDLLSDPSIDGSRRDSITRSFRDYTEDADGPGLAEELMNEFDPDGMELARELKDIHQDLDNLIRDPGEIGEDGETAAKPEEAQTGRESRRPGSGEGELPGARPMEGEAAATAAGSSPGSSDEPAGFEPWEGESPEARLPEGEIRQAENEAILRLEGDEDFSLERVSPDYTGGERVIEEEIPVMTIPENKTRLVRDYFTSIGAEPGTGGSSGEFE